MPDPERPEHASQEHVDEARALATTHRNEAKVLEGEARMVVTRLKAVEDALRDRTRIALMVGVLVFVVGVFMVVSQVQAGVQRQRIDEAVQEIRDCTTPGEDNACQRRLVPVERAQSEDNLRASIAVGSCLRQQAPDVYACAMQKFEELRAAASTVPP